MAFVTDTDLASTAAGKGAAMVGYVQEGPAAPRTALEKLREFATFEDFGAVGDYDSASGTGTDDTAAIQAAIDWAYAEGAAAPRAVLMTAKNFLCGQITIYPTTTIIGTGRQTSAFWCKIGTTGKWWSTRGHGAQKMMLSGISWYGRNQSGLTHILELGTNASVADPAVPEAPFGTEGILEGLWVREAPNGIGLLVLGNVGLIKDVTAMRCATNIKVLGNANLLSNIVSMEAGVCGADLSGCVVHRIEIEATAQAGLPLRMNGDVSVDGLFLSTAVGWHHDHLIEVDLTTYNEWAITKVALLGESAPATSGILKVGSAYYGGTSAAAFTGASFQRSLDLHSTDFSVKHQKIQAFSLQIINDGGTIKHRMGALADASLSSNLRTRIIGATSNLSVTPTGSDASTAFAAGGKISSTYPSAFILDTAAQETPDQLATAQVLFSQAGKSLTAWMTMLPLNVNGVTRQRLMVQLFDAASGVPFDLATLPTGKALVIGITGYIA